ncbi:hypothetical protein R69927_02175 [Paraburkholderia domus]|uniref:DUF3443 domain-containing protein n=1 Tax=Paraburkholderia domus TaxID=2793075 RepID=A0A9N8N204_9BURK|nr:DUF3443 domain-containing protein [Paraburkholderia domus]MBK5050031.1 DUF3443 domain-containing protein [Burkholderia sp. R-70006]MBK5063067.1 DUF3443 domain-containing protein [Burkholderia sp. R-70199]MBK5086766.1 DUF3443 domain-containing protein [Burkholderia sp. R-69927]MBK5121488.1 DUF3443 domain-containing protein [Burkholderia sp. R-69980]MBK5166632.1 DUF3443 domain-containing protein [Burkholderia sp. R-70211]MBK5182506.1 DUF3443 domain-containing protein [Burkholderia sp. R-6974
MKSSSHLYALLLVCAALAGCGGGGGTSADSSPAGSASPPSSPSAASPSGASAPSGAAVSSTATSVPQSSTPNVQPITVAAAPGLTRNMLTTSVTVCQPGTSNCATINNIQVDTGSHGLRILASALPASLTLAAVGSGSGVTGECAVFGGGYAWGAVRSADVRMAGQLAAAIPIQLISDPAVPNVPTDCAGSGPAMLNVSSLRANGILGVGLFAADCGSGCVNAALPRWYYSCDAGGACLASTQALAQQVSNPVSRFALDNNGVVIDLPAIADAGAVSVSGSMIFGIGTQANNTLGGASVVKANPVTGYVATSSAGQTYAQSYLDSGSNGLFFSNSQLPQCGYWYCPSSTQTASASIIGSDGVSNTVSFAIGNSTALFGSSNNAFNNLAGIASNSFGWGLPFFFGRRVYTAIASRATSAGPGPYYAF